MLRKCQSSLISLEGVTSGPTRCRAHNRTHNSPEVTLAVPAGDAGDTDLEPDASFPPPGCPGCRRWGAPSHSSDGALWLCAPIPQSTLLHMLLIKRPLRCPSRAQLAGAQRRGPGRPPRAGDSWRAGAQHRCAGPGRQSPQKPRRNSRAEGGRGLRWTLTVTTSRLAFQNKRKRLKREHLKREPRKESRAMNPVRHRPPGPQELQAGPHETGVATSWLLRHTQPRAESPPNTNFPRDSVSPAVPQTTAGVGGGSGHMPSHRQPGQGAGPTRGRTSAAAAQRKHGYSRRRWKASSRPQRVGE